MRVFSNADYASIIKLLSAIAEGRDIKPNEKRKSSLIIKKSRKKYGK